MVGTLCEKPVDVVAFLIVTRGCGVSAKGWLLFVAGVAQLEEQLTCNQQVAGSSPIASSIECIFRVSGEVPEWSKGTDCKSVGRAFGGSNPPLSTTLL